MSNNANKTTMSIPDDDIDITLVDKELEGEKGVVSPDVDDGKLVIVKEENGDLTVDAPKEKKKPVDRAEKEDDDENPDDESESEFRQGNPDDETEIEREARRLANRARREANKDKRRRAASYKDSKIAELERKVQELSGSVAATSRSSQLDIDAMAIKTAVNERTAMLENATKAWKEARQSGNDDQELAAMSSMLEAKNALELANNAFKEVNRRREMANKPIPANDGNTVKNSFVDRKAQQFRDDNPWYDPTGNDRDSKRAISISEELIEDGFLPNHTDYWKELRDRIEDELPHRVKSNGRDGDDDDDQPRKAANTQTKKLPVTTSNRERAPERRNALDELNQFQKTMLAQSGLDKASDEYKRIVATYIAKNRAAKEA